MKKLAFLLLFPLVLSSCAAGTSSSSANITVASETSSTQNYTSMASGSEPEQSKLTDWEIEILQHDAKVKELQELEKYVVENYPKLLDAHPDAILEFISSTYGYGGAYSTTNSVTYQDGVYLFENHGGAFGDEYASDTISLTDEEIDKLYNCLYVVETYVSQDYSDGPEVDGGLVNRATYRILDNDTVRNDAIFIISDKSSLSHLFSELAQKSYSEED